MMDFARFARFQDEADVGADGLVDEIMVQGCRGQEGRNGGHARVDAAVGQDEDVGAVLDGFKASMQSDSMAVSMPSAPLLTG